MKLQPILLTIAIVLATIVLFAQVPEGFNYQAVARSSAGAIVANTPIQVDITLLLDGSTTVYKESHSDTTNELGLFTLVVGHGTSLSGTFSSIGWTTGSYSMKVEVNFGGGLLDMGTSQLLTVPFAMNARNGVPAGTMMPYAGATPPAGWLLCNGSSISRVDYADLFAAIKTAWGSVDGSTFRLPDARGRFLRGVDGGTGRDPDAAIRTVSNAGGNVGDTVGSQQYWGTALPPNTTSSPRNSTFNGTTASNGAHTHTVTLWEDDWFQTGGSTQAIDNDATGNSGTDIYTTSSNGSHTHAFSVTAGGNNQTRPLNINVNYIIKY